MVVLGGRKALLAVIPLEPASYLEPGNRPEMVVLVCAQWAERRRMKYTENRQIDGDEQVLSMLPMIKKNQIVK